ncbi:monovalent cation/H(+) antiporter subunit G [Haloarchaeobius sp. TZWWS8]|uniref:monovalent cation/H(+) antiporter subunit G n=1 Tax=Haloarchaeobius sp. TZWWS8 TaxID=3446121 RepID=UPI003EB79364
MALASTIQYAVVAALVLVGSFFLLVGTIGLIRLPNVYNRMHATSKATTLGAASMFLAGFVYFDFQGVGLESLVGILFLFLTAPTGAHMISRSARKMGVDFLEEVEWPVSGAGIDAGRRRGDAAESAEPADD